MGIATQIGFLANALESRISEFGAESNIGLTPREAFSLLSKIRNAFHPLGSEEIDVSEIPAKLKSLNKGFTNEDLEKLYYIAQQAYKSEVGTFGAKLTEALEDYIELNSRALG